MQLPAAPKEAYAASGIGAGNLVDSGNVCWKAPEMFYFVRNLCNTDITATIKVSTRHLHCCTSSDI